MRPNRRPVGDGLLGVCIQLQLHHLWFLLLVVLGFGFRLGAGSCGGRVLHVAVLLTLRRTLRRQLHQSRSQSSLLNTDSRFFKLDAHVDPMTDGPHVFILGLLSGTVITFSPVDCPTGVRKNPAQIARSSWTDSDIDCLFRLRSLVSFSGDARYNLNHGIRAGVEVLQENGEPLVCDWWGRLENLLPRREERLSIVFAFADCLDDKDTAGGRNSNDVSKETREAEVQATTTHQ
uniref:Uncharacterized protein n=1 Tax=Vitrella brassicaformis TaxID=1169539 RepID=A0A7S1KF66_9ALVE|mmetsp:Transcript_51715/g.129878  ORF Transcript_51715/g.129878 Transcript_51715/m.129878 type:complete len:233 (+) Transcript_51715:1099-1797(+)